ncbi:nuclear transport factor 2 family protein [candidate division KSB1 bacterium]
MQFNAKKFIKNINYQHWEKVENFFHKDIEFSNPFCPEPIKGKEKVREVMGEQIHILPNFEYEIVKAFVDDEGASLELERKGGKIVWKGLPYAVQYKFPEVMLIEFKDDKIFRIRNIFDAGYIMRGIEKAMAKQDDDESILGKRE